MTDVAECLDRIATIKAAFSPIETEAHHLLLGMLYAMYATPQTLDIPMEQDQASDQSAALIIDGLKHFGIRFTKEV
jgi:hypothetical protein